MQNANFSPDSKVWIYQSSRPFTQDEIEALNIQLAAFAKQWTAHNAQLHAEATVIEDRIIRLMVDETHTGASGCSIDSSVHFIKSIEKAMGINLFDRTLVNYYKGDHLFSTHLDALKKLYQQGELHDDTLVFNPLIATKSDFDNGCKIELGKTWLKDFAT